MQLTLKKIVIENFKGITSMSIDFSDKTEICGQNACGKTTIADAYFFCLFGTDSEGNAKFESRPLDVNGDKIHNTVISVEVILVADERQVSLKRTIEENWVTKRGSTEAVLSGNIGKYYIDGYPRQEREYNDYVASIIGQKAFKILTSPAYFASLPWKEQREIVMQMSSDKSDAEIATIIGGFDALSDTLAEAPSTDAALQKYRSELKMLKAKQTEIPIRIDEAMKGVVDIDVDALNAARAMLSAEIKDVESQILSATDQNERVRLLTEIEMIKTEQRKYAQSLNEESDSKRNDITRKIVEANNEADYQKRMVQREISEIQQNIEANEKLIKKCGEQVAFYQGEIDKANADWKSVKSKKYVESDATCPTCGQPLPKSMLADRRKKWDESNERLLEQITKAGKEAVEARNACNEKAGKAEEEISEQKKTLDIANEKLQRILSESEKTLTELHQQLRNIPAAIDPEDDPKCRKYSERINELTEKVSYLTLTGVTNGLRQKRDEISTRIKEIDSQLAKDATNKALTDRANSLRAELLQVSANAVYVEGQIELIEQFVKAKLSYLTEEIKNRFYGVSFKLFNVQVNGGISETCEISYNGVPYAALNSGHRIVAGLLVIKALSGLYGITCPIFVDNAETINDYNIPEIDSQLVLLRVTDDKTLTVR